MLVGDFLSNAAVRAPDRVALIGSGQRLRYAQFDAAANRLANALMGLGLDKGARVAILASNRPEYAIADRKSTRLNSSHMSESRMPSSA